MRRQCEQCSDDADYDYTNPSTYLDRLVPIPKWIQECNDREFRCIINSIQGSKMFNLLHSTIKEPFGIIWTPKHLQLIAIERLSNPLYN